MKKRNWKMSWINNELKMTRPVGRDSIEVRDLYWTERWRYLLYGKYKQRSYKLK